MASEKVLEKKLKSEVEKLGGLALKFSSSFNTGYPDRVVLFPGGKTYWVELKSTGKKPTKLQVHRMKELTRLEHLCFVIDDEQSLQTFLNFLK